MKKLIARHVPIDFLTSHVHEVNELHLSVRRAIQNLHELNQNHAFVFSVNVMRVKAYVHALCKQRRLKLTPS